MFGGREEKVLLVARVKVLLYLWVNMLLYPRVKVFYLWVKVPLHRG